VARYTPQFGSSYQEHDWGLATFYDWGIILTIAIAGAIVWSFADRKSKNYQALYNWLRVLIRYRLAIAVIAYGFLKLFAMQAPQPSLSSLNTPYGDFSAWKLFSLSLGIVPGYQSFLGAVELIAGLLLLFRRTSVIGATIIIFFTGNVFMSNLAYEGGEVVYSFFLVTLALFLVAYDLQRIVSLIILNKPTAPAWSGIKWTKQQQVIRLGLKSVIVIVFVVIYGFSAKRNAVKGGYHFSRVPAVKGFNGLYDVISFSVDGRDYPYDLADTVRWQNVVFERWASLSIKTNGKYKVVNDSVERVPIGKARSAFEYTGTRGRIYYSYLADTVQKVLHLQNETEEKHQQSPPQLSYVQHTDSTITLTGIVNGKNIVAILEKSNKKYLLKASEKGRRSGLKL